MSVIGKPVIVAIPDNMNVCFIDVYLLSIYHLLYNQYVNGTSRYYLRIAGYITSVTSQTKSRYFYFFFSSTKQTQR